MPAGPTTEGSIVAYLRLNASDFFETLDRAEAKARELGRVDSNVRVKADTAGAMAKLDAVEAAQRRVAAAEIKYAAAADLATSAADRQWRVNQRLSSSEEAKQRATDASTRATAKADLASLALTEAQDRLAAAQEKVTAAATAEAAAQDAAGNSADKTATRNKTNVTYMAAMVAAVAALMPMLAPLAGYAVGVSGALAGMGAAGVLAILGIKNAMAAGTEQGTQYSQGLQILKGDLSQLENSAATSMLSSFNGAIKILDGAMPQLNSEIGQFSSLLGTVGNTILSGTINAFRILNPLFMASGQYVEHLAAGFQSWTQDGGLQRFASYALSRLPLVEHTLGDLASAAVNLIGALSPLGTVMLNMIDWASGVIGMLDQMGPVLAIVAGGAAAGYGAFTLWGVIAPLIANVASAVYKATDSVVALGIALDVSSGPVGLVVAGIGALAAVLAVVAAAAPPATTAQDAYTSALQQSNGVIDDTVRKTVAKQLADAGALDLAKQLGIALPTVTDAVTGQGDANQKLTDSLNATVAAGTRSISAGKTHTFTMTDQATAAKKLLDIITQQSGAIDGSTRSLTDQAAASSGVNTATQSQATYLGITADAYQVLASQVDLATTASKNWKTEQDLVNGIAQSVEQTNITLSLGYTTMASTIAANIKSTNRATATSMDINTQYGAQNHQLILNRVQDAAAAADAQVAADIKVGKSQATAAADGNAILAAQKQKIEDQAVAAGLDRGEVEKLLAQIDLLKPKDITLSVQTTAAMSALAAFDRAWASVGVTASTASAFAALANANAAMGRVAGHADGGPIYRAAGGPIEAAYLASGGNPFAPRGTDTIPAMLTLGEFVVRQPAAAYDPQFLKAYNQNPQKALDSVAQPQSTRSAKPAPILHIDHFHAEANQSPAEIGQYLGWQARA